MFEHIMADNLAKRKKREAEAAAAYKARKKAERDAWYATMERELARLPSRIPELKEQMEKMIVDWLQEEGAEPEELTIRPATQEELENSACFYNDIDGYPPVEAASRLTLDAGLALHISSQDKALFGGIDGIVHFMLDEEGGRWCYPNYDCDYSGGDHPFTTRERSYWGEDY